LSMELVGDYAGAAAIVNDAGIARSKGDTPSSSAWSALARARCELAIGRPGPAKRAAIESATDFADVNHPSGLRWAHGASMLASALAGDRAAARDAVAIFDHLDEGVPFLDVDVLRARAWAAWVLGHSSVAATLLREAAALAVDSGAVTLEAVALHDAFRLLRAPVADRLAVLARRAPVPGIVLRCRHVAGVAAQDPDELLAVTAKFERVGALLLAAESAGDAARLATEQGRRSTARTAVGQRVRLADLCGNPLTPGLAGHQPITLTSRERDVATLAVEGRTSREIAQEFAVSVRTVDNLLQRVYVKLGVHGRAELAERMAEPLA
ncbi:MAG: LuxR C-terminal-related transcriptional regulator, partial [Ilumatobacteraceae bacterium]